MCTFLSAGVVFAWQHVTLKCAHVLVHRKTTIFIIGNYFKFVI